MAQSEQTRAQPIDREAGNRVQPGEPTRRGGELGKGKRHPLKALKVFALILFDVFAEIRQERKYRKEFKA